LLARDRHGGVHEPRRHAAPAAQGRAGPGGSAAMNQKLLPLLPATAELVPVVKAADLLARSPRRTSTEDAVDVPFAEVKKKPAGDRERIIEMLKAVHMYWMQ